MAPRAAAFLLIASLFLATSAVAQTLAERADAAKKVFLSHTKDSFLHDDQPATVAELQNAWQTMEAEAVDFLDEHPNATADDLELDLCPLAIASYESPHDCHMLNPRNRSVILLTDGLFAVTQSFEGFGTAFVVGPRNAHNAILWTIDTATPQQNDPHDLIGAWRADRAGIACRDEKSIRKPGSCGPLYASIGILPPDSSHHPRFYIDAGYTQAMGFTIGKQTTIWRWDGDHATLLWSKQYDFMIDQEVGTSAHYGILRIGEKSEFRTAYDCGSCASRVTVHSVMLTADGVEDLGTRSLVPELDLIDETLDRIMRHRPVSALAAPAVVHLLQQRIDSALQGPETPIRGPVSFGMVGDHSIRLTAKGAKVCFNADEFGGTVLFSLIRRDNGGYFIANATPLSDGSHACPLEATSFPPEQPQKPATDPLHR